MIGWFARNPVAANLVMWLIVAAGLITAPGLRQDIFPEVKIGMITVTVVYPGATPQEVEEAICIPIEEAIFDLEGVKRVTATAREGIGTVAAELAYRADGRKLLEEIKARIDAIDRFPEEATRPLVVELESFKNVIDVALSGLVGERTLKELGEDIRDEISELPGISHVELANVRPWEVSIEITERTLRRHGLSFEGVASAVRRASLDLPGGNLETVEEEILLRTRAQARRGREFEELVIRTRPDGTRLRLGDVAEVVDGFADTHHSARFDGTPAVLIEVFRAGDERVLDIVATVQRYLEGRRRSLPEGVELTIWRDGSIPLRARRDLMLENGAYGLVLVLLVLSLFLRPRIAFWVAMGIPISFLGAVALMPALDVSVNTISLVAFMVALGLVVDDAIVIGDAVARREDADAGGSGVEAATRGARAVVVPVVVAALTSMVMLLPILLLGGIGQQGHPLPKIVIACLGFSLVEAFIVFPAHLAHGRGKRLRFFPYGLQRRVSDLLEGFVDHAYRPLLAIVLDNRAAALAAGFALLALTHGLVVGGWVPLTFLPEAESDYVAASLTMPEGTPAVVVERHALHLEAAAERLRKELDAPGVFRHVFTSLGSQPEKRRQGFFSALTWNAYTGPHLAEVQIGLSPREEREISTGEVARRWRTLVGEIPDAVELSFPTALYSLGDRLSIQLAGSDGALLESSAEALRVALGSYPGVRDIATSARRGKREISLEIRAEAEGAGITAADLARQVRQGFHGEEVQRARRGRDDVPVVVRFPRGERRSFAALDQMAIRTPTGAEMPFWTVARPRFARSPAMIRRADRKRTVRVTADLDTERINENEIVASLQDRVLPRILADHPGVTYSLQGQQREQAEFIGTLRSAYLFGLVLIFVLLAIPLRSYVQPAFILLAVPFGWVGAVLGHGVFGLDITMFTLVGVVGVTGVVINDSLVLLYAINEERGSGLPLLAAVERASLTRFRPILLTTLTTFLGLTPILLERSSYAQDLKPMAISLAFGELVSTAIILLLVPAAYVSWEERRRVAQSG